MTRRGAPFLLLALLAGLLATPAAAAAPPQTTATARLQLDQLRPRVVTANGPRTLLVTGTVRNTGDVPLAQLAVRVQRSWPLAEPAGARAVLRSEAVPAAAVVTRFFSLDTALAPGQSAPFRIEVGLGSGPPGTALRIQERGVYPVTLALNGIPRGAGLVRLDTASLLLPVLAPPGGEPTATAGAQPAPAGVTVVWPLVAEPARLPTRPGEPVLLRGDELLAQISAGGRLDALVSALHRVTQTHGPLAEAVCVAVDPALLDTVAAMARGYRVATPTGQRPGTGADEARRWLARLRAVVDGGCVLALPYADPDLVALSRAGLTGLEALARSTGNRVVERVLDVTPMTGLSWPAGGVLDGRTLSDLTALGTRAVLLAPRALTAVPDDPPTSVTITTGASGSAAPRGLLIDPLAHRALAGSAERGSQNALGILAYRALRGSRGPLLLVPPRRWRTDQADAAGLLRGMRTLIDTGLLRPRPLPSLLDGPKGPPAALGDPPAAHLRPDTTARVGDLRDTLRDLQAATRRDPAVDLKPAALLDPVRLTLLRATSTAWRDDPDRAAAWVDTAAGELADLRSSVRIVPPSGPYTLTSSDSPVLVTVANELPVSVAVTVTVDPVAGLSTAAPKQAMVPARSSRQVRIPATLHRGGRFSTVVRLATPGGTALGEPATLRLRSSSFDTVTLAITAGAGVALVALVALRLARRLRGRRPQQAGQA